MICGPAARMLATGDLQEATAGTTRSAQTAEKLNPAANGFCPVEHANEQKVFARELSGWNPDFLADRILAGHP